MNILLLSVGTRNKLVRYFKEALSGAGIVAAADSSGFAPALYEADRCYLVPPITENTYLDRVLSLCRKEQLAGVLSLIDPEVSLLAAHSEAFRAAGTTVIGSPWTLCELARDKSKMYGWLTAHGYRCAQTWQDQNRFRQSLTAGDASFPVCIKPVSGAASSDVFIACDMETVDLLLARRSGLLIQEYLAGQEIGVDAYADLLTGEVVSVFAKRKLRMRAGETDKSVSFKDDALFSLIERFVAEAGFRGPVDIDLFEVDGRYYISEVNPRFGGGYPHAHACGCDFTKLIVNNLNGIANERRIGDYEEGVCMMKYSDMAILRESELVKS